MAITGVLQADFAQFDAAARQSTTLIKGMEGGAAKTEAAITRMATTPVGGINTLRTSFSSVDQVLNASGVNVGKYARGLVEIEAMAGQTVSQLGLLSTAASVFGAAMAGWNFGRAIAGFLGADEAIGNFTAKLLGFGDVAAETAGAGADVLALASTRAGRAITTMSEALVVNTKFVQDRAAALTDQADAAANAVRPESDLMRAWNESAAAADGYTGAWTNLHEASTIYGDGLPPVTEKTKTLIEVLDEILGIQGPLQEGFRFTSTTVGELGDSFDVLTAKVTAAKEAEAAHANQANANAEASAATLAESGFSMTGSVQKLTDRQVEKMTGESNIEAQLKALYQKRDTLESYLSTIGTRGGPQIQTLAQYNKFAADTYLLSQLSAYLQGKDRPPSFAGGVTNFGGGLARVHEGELLVNMPSGTDVIPRGGGRGGGTVVNHFHMSGMVGDRAGLARTLKHILVNGERAAGKRLAPSGAVG